MSFAWLIASEMCYLALLNSGLSLSFICFFMILQMSNICDVELGIRAKIEQKGAKTELNSIKKEAKWLKCRWSHKAASSPSHHRYTFSPGEVVGESPWRRNALMSLSWRNPSMSQCYILALRCHRNFIKGFL